MYMTPTLDSALLCSSLEGSDLGPRSDRLEELCHSQVELILCIDFHTHTTSQFSVVHFNYEMQLCHTQFKLFSACLEC